MPIIEKFAIGTGLYLTASLIVATAVGRFLKSRSVALPEWEADRSRESLLNLGQALGTAPGMAVAAPSLYEEIAYTELNVVENKSEIVAH